jgi:hydroxymethylpyrimidine pyrophosphatase-like HAD family hydrolase
LTEPAGQAGGVRRIFRFQALATDYDGTLAREGIVAPSALAALDRLRQSGRALLMVTGRELSDLRRVFDRLRLFDRVVVENGAVLLDPASDRVRLLAPPPPRQLLEALRRRHLPFSLGHSIVATGEHHEAAVVDAIRESGAEMTIAFNKGSLMVLPAGWHKALGLAAALEELGISPDAVVGVGDGENDHAFLDACGFAVAVSSAVPLLRERADWVTPGGAGEGVEQLIDRLLDDDLAGLLRASGSARSVGPEPHHPPVSG